MSNEHVHVPPNDFWLMLLSTVRYAMGRRSYIVGTACDMVLQYRHSLRPEQIEQIAREVDAELRLRMQALGGRTLGDDMDHREWSRLVERLRPPPHRSDADGS